MAGRPKLRELETRISEKPGGDEWVFEQLADGCTVAQVAEKLGVSRRFLYTWRDSGPRSEQRKEAWREAIRISAEVDVELIETEFDRLDRVIGVDEETGEPVRRIPHSSEVALATGRAKYRQWRAAVKDPERFGKQDQTNVNVLISSGDAHLEALRNARQLRPRDPRELQALPVGDSATEPEGPDYEIVE